jgi:hypothetical protein
MNTDNAMKMFSEGRASQISECLWEWMPGDGSRYEMALTETGNGKLFTWLHANGVGGRSFLIKEGLAPYIDPYYFMEKTGITKEREVNQCLRFLHAVGAIGQLELVE